MPKIDKVLVKQKIGMADEYFKRMKKHLGSAKSAAEIDIDKRDALERTFELTVEKMLEINYYFIKTLASKPVDDLKSTFTTMGDLGILPPDFARKISSVTAVRNILVHQYEKLDFDLFLQNLRNNIGDFETYFSYVLKFIENAD